jgi:hypothetical protein
MSRSIQVLVAPSGAQTRLMVREGGERTLLRATLSANPAHPRALPWFLESLALWEGETVRGVLVVDAEGGGCASTLFRDAFTDFGTRPLYTLDWAPVVRGRRAGVRARHLGMAADFRDLAQLEVRRGTR